MNIGPLDSNAWLAAIVESSDDAIISKNLNGIILSWNLGAQRIFGYTAEEAVGKPILLLIPEDRRHEEDLILSRLRAGQRIEHYETIRRTKDGRLLNIALTISPVRNQEGVIVGVSKIARDITERKRIEEALEEAHRRLRTHAYELEKKVEERTAKLQTAIVELEAFSYSVSHDVRAPLRAMMQYAQICLNDYGPRLDEDGLRYLNRIVTSATRLDGMVRDLLSFSRIMRANVEIHPVNLDGMVHDLIAENPAYQPPQADVQITSPLLPVLGNETFLSQCLGNLLGNAVKFVAPGQVPRVRIWTEKRDQKVRLWVVDHGIGISPEDAAKMFVMFSRVQSGAYEGTGLGLCIVKKAVERMNGTVGFESEPGKGSRFWIELPEPAILGEPRRAW